ncbi:hypothetical protein ES703_101103 [subsurface metagenome]
MSETVIGFYQDFVVPVEFPKSIAQFDGLTKRIQGTIKFHQRYCHDPSAPTG